MSLTFVVLIVFRMRINSTNLLIPGAIGQIESILDSNENKTKNKYIAVCCHPHPQHGGTMFNKVIYTASRTLAGMGITSLRFNFRGVGRSEGAYSEGVGEVDDLAAVIAWVKINHPLKKLILVGFSFGAYVSISKSNELDAKLLVSIAPPIGRMTFTNLDKPACPWLIVQGRQDEIVDYLDVESWVGSFSEPPELVLLENASHFFHAQLNYLRAEIEKFIDTNMLLI